MGYVTLHRYEAGGWTFAGSRLADASGYWESGPLLAGDYRIGFQGWAQGDASGYVDYAPEYYDDEVEFGRAEPVSLAEGGARGSIDAVLDPWSHVKGRVTDTGTGRPLVGIRVVPFRYSDASGYFAPTYGGALTDASGYYDMGWLSRGRYKFGFNTDASGYYRDASGYLPEYYDDKSTLELADEIPIAAGHTLSGIDAGLRAYARIAGFVSDASTGRPMANVPVTVYRYSDASGYWALKRPSAYTDGSGYYKAGFLPQGSFKVGFNVDASGYFDASGYPHGMRGWASEYYDDKPNLADAQEIPLDYGQAREDIDAALAPVGISGRITATGRADSLVGTSIQFFRSDASGYWTHMGFAEADASGYYRSGPLPGGDYRVFFQGGFMDASGYDWEAWIPEYFDDEVEFGRADTVTLAEGGGRAGVDAALEPPAHISGVVRDEATGLPLSGVPVTLYRHSDASGYWPLGWPRPQTDASGYYDAGWLPRGSYKVGFSMADSSGYSAYVPEYFNNKPTLELADEIPIAAGHRRTGVDAALAQRVPDTTPPITSVSSLPMGWVADDVEFSLTATDATSPDGIRTYYGLNAPPTTNYFGPETVSFEGTTTIYYYSEDRFGNAESVQFAQVRIDETAPSQPGAPVASGITDTVLTLTWPGSTDELSGLDHYEVLKGGIVIGDVTGTSLSVTTGLSAGQTYSFSVRAVDAAGNVSALGGPTTVKMLAPPAAPTGLASALQAGPQVRLTWSDKATNETGFSIERALGSGAFAEIATVGPRNGTGGVTYYDTTVVPQAGRVYRYRVRAANGPLASAYSGIVSATFPALPPSPTLKTLTPTPSGLLAKIAAAWTNVANETGYVLQRATTADFTANLVEAGTSSASLTQTGLARDTTYYFRVRAFGLSGASDWSNVLSTWTGVPAAPALTSLSAVAGATSDKVTATWMNVEWEQSYTLRRALNPGFTSGVNSVNSPADTTTKTQTGLKKLTTYYYRVQAKNAFGVSAWSNDMSILTP